MSKNESIESQLFKAVNSKWELEDSLQAKEEKISELAEYLSDIWVEGDTKPEIDFLRPHISLGIIVDGKNYSGPVINIVHKKYTSTFSEASQQERVDHWRKFQERNKTVSAVLEKTGLAWKELNERTILALYGSQYEYKAVHTIPFTKENLTILADAIEKYRAEQEQVKKRIGKREEATVGIS